MTRHRHHPWPTPARRQGLALALTLLTLAIPATAAPQPRPSRAEATLLAEVMTMAATNLPAALTTLDRHRDADSAAILDLAAGNLRMQAGQLPAAIRAYHEALAKAPDDADAWHNLGRACLLNDQPGPAADAYRALLRVSGENTQRHFLLGQALLLDNQPLLAESAFRQALLLDGNNTDAQAGLVKALLELERLPEAATALDPLLRNQPQTPELWTLKANLRLAGEDLTGAIVTIETARRLQAATPDLLALLGDLYLQREDPASATRAYSEAFAGTHQPSPARLLRAAEGLLLTGQTNAAAQLLDRATPLTNTAAMPPQQQRHYQRLRAELALMGGHLEAAVTGYQQLLVADPLDGESLLRLGALNERQDLPESARLHYERATRLPACAYRAETALAQLDLARQDYPAAIARLERALLLQDQPALRRYLEQVRRLATP